jgi:hypothetical protein
VTAVSISNAERAGNMATVQREREEPKRKVLVAPSLNGNGMRGLILAGVAAVISVGAHAGVIFLLLNLDLGPAQGQTGGEVTVAPIVDDGTDAKKKAEEQKEEKPDKDRGKEDDIDLSRTDIGNDSFKDTNYDTTRLGDISVPQLDPNAGPNDAPGSLDPNITNTKQMAIPPPPGTGGVGPGGIPHSADGTAAMIPGVPNVIGTGLPGSQVPNLFAGRGSAVTRERMLEQGGGNKESEAMVARGLQFLANHQAMDGHWGMHDFDRHARKQTKNAKGEAVVTFEKDKSMPGTTRQNDVAGTGFGLLPFLAAGHTHHAVKDSKFDYSKNVKLGLIWLIKQQDKDKNGYYGGDMYAHAIASIAMCEAYGLTADPMLKLSAQRAVHYLEYAQDPSGGGWRYGPQQPGDTSVTGWCMMALKSGQMAGLSVKPEVLKKAEKFLDSCESSNKGGYSYTPGGGEGITMTAVGLLCRQYMGVTPRNPGLLQGVQRLERSRPDANHNIYYLYYATQVMHHMGGDNWDEWNKGADGKAGIRDTLIALMDKGTTNPDLEGSWDPKQLGAEGRLMSTSLALLTLEVYYRHLPLYRRDAGQVKGAQ